ncbi:MAG: PDZ domain-containing protein [Bacteroidota bacterium]
MKLFTSTSLFLFFSFVFAFSQNHDDFAFLGVHSNSISEKKAKKLNFPEENGAYITNVIDNTAAEKAGFQPFDYIYQVDENKFGSHQSMRSMMTRFNPGGQVKIYFMRDGQAMEKDVVLGKKSDAKDRHRSRSEDPFLGVENNHSSVPQNVNGVRVNIVENSTAEEMGLEDNDIITKINGYPMIDWHDVGTAIDALEVGDPIAVTYVRDNKITTVTNPVKSLAATKDGGINHGSWSYSYSYSYEHWNKHEKEEEEEIPEEIVFTEDMEIEMEDMPLEDAEQMKEELGIDMPVIQNLRIEELAIFPNPTVSMFNLQFELPETGKTAIRVFNSSGQIIYTEDLNNFSGYYNGKIDLGGQPAGTYFVMIQQSEFSVSKKLIVTRA